MFDLSNRAAAAEEIKKALQAQPFRRTSLDNLFSKMSGRSPDAATAAIRKVHDAGVQLDTPDQEYLRKVAFVQYAPEAGTFRKSKSMNAADVKRISKFVLATYRGRAATAGRRMTSAEMLACGQALRKLSLPGQSSNARNTNELADTGAATDIARQPVPAQKPTLFGARSALAVTDPKTPPQDETIAALQAIFKAGPKRAFA